MSFPGYASTCMPALSKIAPGEREIAAGDEVVTLDRVGGLHRIGYVVDIEDGTASLHVGHGVWFKLPLSRVAHPDSPYVEAL